MGTGAAGARCRVQRRVRALVSVHRAGPGRNAAGMATAPGAVCRLGTAITHRYAYLLYHGVFSWHVLAGQRAARPSGARSGTMRALFACHVLRGAQRLPHTEEPGDLAADSAKTSPPAARKKLALAPRSVPITGTVDHAVRTRCRRVLRLANWYLCSPIAIVLPKYSARHGQLTLLR